MAHSMMSHRAMRAVAALVALLALGAYASAVIVREGEVVLITRFGKPQRTASEPGLHWKLPWPIDQTTVIDMRARIYETGHTEMLTRDKKNIIARSFVVWRVGDPLLFSQAVGEATQAEVKLDGLLTNAAIGTLGGHDLSALVSTTPADLHVDTIEAELLAATERLALERYGVKVEQVRLERVSLPEENVTAVFAQMRAERKQFAAKSQAEGAREAARIESEAKLQAAEIRAKGDEEAARIRGQADAEIAKTYADAHRVDAELYRFTRSLESIQKLVTQNTSLILRTDSEPFSLLQSQPK